MAAEEARVAAEGVMLVSEDARVASRSARVASVGIKTGSKDTKATSESIIMASGDSRASTEGVRAVGSEGVRAPPDPEGTCICRCGVRASEQHLRVHHCRITSRESILIMY